MQLIRELSDLLDDEIKGVKEYAQLAAREKATHPQLAAMLFTISNQESEHVTKLHEGVSGLIMEYRKEYGEPPKEMQAVYNYLHEKHIDKMQEAKRYQEIYNRS